MWAALAGIWQSYLTFLTVRGKKYLMSEEDEAKGTHPSMVARQTLGRTRVRPIRLIKSERTDAEAPIDLPLPKKRLKDRYRWL